MTNYFIRPDHSTMTAAWLVDPDIAVSREIPLPDPVRTAPALLAATMAALSAALWSEMYAPSRFEQPTDRIIGALRNTELVGYLAGDDPTEAVFLSGEGDQVAHWATRLRSYLAEESVKVRYAFLVEATSEIEAWEWARNGDFRGRARQVLPHVYKAYGPRLGSRKFWKADANDDTPMRPSYDEPAAS